MLLLIFVFLPALCEMYLSKIVRKHRWNVVVAGLSNSNEENQKVKTSSKELNLDDQSSNQNGKCFFKRCSHSNMRYGNFVLNKNRFIYNHTPVTFALTNVHIHKIHFSGHCLKNETNKKNLNVYIYIYMYISISMEKKNIDSLR